MHLVYVHLSDIHFGQEKGGQIIVNDDVKEQLIMDARHIVSSLTNEKAEGIILSGDVAFAGKKEEYDKAGLWLDRLTAAVGCARTSVQVVPGNHDINRKLVTAGTQLIIDDILRQGDDALDKYLEADEDREILHNRFSAYRTFAAAYNCELDGEGSILGHKIIEIASNKYLKFLGINTALICSKNKEEKGKLLLGKRQRVIQTQPGVEIVVVAHHPLNWIQDSEDARKYISSRARIFLSGHEHMPAHHLEKINESADLLSIAAGASVPPKANETYTYCYNILEFSWDEKENLLKVVIYPRIWNDEIKAFDKDSKHFKGDSCIFTLKCPNYLKAEGDEKGKKEKGKKDLNVRTIDKSSVTPADVETSNNINDNSEQILLLKFFRELSTAQRISIFINMGVFPTDLPQPITHNTEVLALRKIFAEQRTEELNKLMTEFLNTKIERNNND